MSKKDKKIKKGPAPTSTQKPNRFRPTVFLLAIVGLCFLIRLSWIEHIDPRLYPPSVGVGDGRLLGWDGNKYDDIARNLLAGAGYGYHPNEPDAWRPPGYPFFLFVIYKIFGHNYTAVRLIQVLIGCAVALLLYFLTLKLTDLKLAAFTAAFLYTIDYYSVIFTSILYTEHLTSFLCLLAVYLFVLAKESKTNRAGILFFAASLIYWFAVLVRPSNLLFWGWIGLWWWLENRRHFWRVLTAALLTTFTFALIVLPWTARNYRLYGKFLLVSSNGGFIFFMSHHPNSDGGFIPEPIRYTEEQKKKLGGLDPIEADKQHYRFGTEFIHRHPKRALELAWLKLKWFWLARENRGFWFDTIPGIPVPLVTFYFVAVASAVGLFFCLRNFRSANLILGYVFFHVLSTVLLYFYHGPRTRIPIVPFLAILAGIGIVRSIQSVKRTLFS